MRINVKKLLFVIVMLACLVALCIGILLSYGRQLKDVCVGFVDEDNVLVGEISVLTAPFPEEGRGLNAIRECSALVLCGVEKVSFNAVWKVLAYGFLSTRQKECRRRSLSIRLNTGDDVEITMFGGEWTAEYRASYYPEKTPSFDITQVEDEAAFLEVMSRVDAGHPLDLVCDVESASGAQLVKALTLFRENAKPGDKVYVVPK